MSLLASVSDSLKVWKYTESRLTTCSTYNPPEAKTCFCVSWNHTNQVVAVGGTDSQVYLVQASNGQVLSALQLGDPTSPKHIKPKTVAFSGNSRYLATATDNNLQLWDLKKRLLKNVFQGHSTTITTSCFLPDGNIAAGDRSGVVKIWEPKSNSSSEDMRPSHHLADSLSSNLSAIAVRDIAVSPVSASFLAAGYADGSLCVWDSATCKLMRTQHCHSGALTSLSYSPKNPRLVATVGSDGKVALMDTGSKSTNEASASIDLGEALSAVSFNEDAIHCAVGVGNGQVLVYDWRNVRKPVASVEAHSRLGVQALAFQVPTALPRVSTSSSTASSLHTSADSNRSALKSNQAAGVHDSAEPADLRKMPQHGLFTSESTRHLDDTVGRKLNSSTSTADPTVPSPGQGKSPRRLISSRSDATDGDLDLGASTGQRVASLSHRSGVESLLRGGGNHAGQVDHNEEKGLVGSGLGMPIDQQWLGATGMGRVSASVSLGASRELDRAPITAALGDHMGRTSGGSAARGAVGEPYHSPKSSQSERQHRYNIHDAQQQTPVSDGAQGAHNAGILDTDEDDDFMASVRREVGQGVGGGGGAASPRAQHNRHASEESKLQRQQQSGGPRPHSQTPFAHKGGRGGIGASTGSEGYDEEEDVRATDVDADFDQEQRQHRLRDAPSFDQLHKDTSRDAMKAERQVGRHYYDYDPFAGGRAAAGAVEETVGGAAIADTGVREGGSSSNSSNMGASRLAIGLTSTGVGVSDPADLREFASVRTALRAVNVRDLDDALQQLRYDIHREVQEIVREQIRQFALAKEDTAQAVGEMRDLLQELLLANRELRAENEYLRRIY